MTDLSTTYLGLALAHPFVAGASPLCDTLEGARHLEDAGASAIVLRSLYEEQLTTESMATHASLHQHAESFGEATSYLPQPEAFTLGADDYLRHLTRVKEAVGVPVMASLNGSGVGPWLEHAALVEQAGADALELNIYDVVTDPAVDGATVEDRAVAIVREARSRTGLPISVKLSPFYTSLANLAARLGEAGADGRVLFNRFFEPDLDAEDLRLRSRLVPSSSGELLLRLRWLGVISGQIENVDLAVTGGVHTGLDGVKSVMCGAHAVQVVSALLVHGPGRLRSIREDFTAWLVEHEYESVTQMRGSMNLARCPDPSVHARSQYVRLLQTWSP